MQTHQLERMLRLANKTGGKLIITDSAGNRPVVILGLDEYEALLDASPRMARSAPAAASVPEKRVQPRHVERVEEDEADVTAMEEALMAVEESMPENIGEEPSIVPVKSIESEGEAATTPTQAAKDRPAPARLAGTASEFSEEQFYLEPL